MPGNLEENVKMIIIKKVGKSLKVKKNL